MGKTENPHLHDFGTFGRVPESQNQLFVLLETPEHSKQNKKNAQICMFLFYFYEPQGSRNPFSSMLEKTSTENPE